MPNEFYRARLLWNSGRREQALVRLNSYFDARLGRPAFIANWQLLESDLFHQFGSAMTHLLNDGRLMHAPFGQVFDILWQLAPTQVLITALLLKDFDTAELDELQESEVDSDSLAKAKNDDSAAVSEVLAHSARKGILSPEPFDLPHGGRPVLTMKMIEEIDPLRGAAVRCALLKHLPPAYAACPPNFWMELVEEEPASVLLRFLHHLFLDYGKTAEEVQASWMTISRRHLGYAAAARESLVRVLQGFTPHSLTEIVQVDAGMTTVENGTAWLSGLQRAMDTADFSELLAS